MADYYLSPTGNDSNNGLSVSTPWLTLGKAVFVMANNDTLNVATGTYNASNGAYKTNKSGWTIQGIGQRPKFILNSGRTGFQMEDSSYITIKNIEFIGDSDNITYAAAKAAYDNNTSTSNAVFSANGIFFRNCHHINVLDCAVRKMPGGGIAFSNSDYFKVDNCVVTDCTKYSAWGNQAITALNAYNEDTNTSTYRNYFTRNRCLRNVNLIPWSSVVGGNDEINEGAGVMLDTTNVSKTNVAYTGKTYIADNICTGNGNAGIQIFKAKNVDLVNNHCFNNNQNIDGGELLLHYSENVKFSHGLLAPKNSSAKYAKIKYTTNCEFSYNQVVDHFNIEEVSNTGLIKFATA